MAKPFSFPVVEVAELLSSLPELPESPSLPLSLELSLLLSLALSLSEDGELALGADDLDFEGGGATFARFGGVKALLVLVKGFECTASTLLSDLSLSTSESLTPTYSVLSVDDFVVFLEVFAAAAFLEATTASLMFLRDGISN